MVINNTMSNSHRMTCDALGALSKRWQNWVRFALFEHRRLSPTKSVPSQQRPATCFP